MLETQKFIGQNIAAMSVILIVSADPTAGSDASNVEKISMLSKVDKSKDKLSSR